MAKASGVLTVRTVLRALHGASQVSLLLKIPPANAGDRRDTSSIPGLGGEHGYPLQYSCLETPMDREALWARVHWVAKSQT